MPHFPYFSNKLVIFLEIFPTNTSQATKRASREGRVESREEIERRCRAVQGHLGGGLLEDVMGVYVWKAISYLEKNSIK